MLIFIFVSYHFHQGYGWGSRLTVHKAHTFRWCIWLFNLHFLFNSRSYLEPSRSVFCSLEQIPKQPSLPKLVHYYQQKVDWIFSPLFAIDRLVKAKFTQNEFFQMILKLVKTERLEDLKSIYELKLGVHVFFYFCNRILAV